MIDSIGTREESRRENMRSGGKRSCTGTLKGTALRKVAKARQREERRRRLKKMERGRDRMRSMTWSSEMSCR